MLLSLNLMKPFPESTTFCKKAFKQWDQCRRKNVSRYYRDKVMVKIDSMTPKSLNTKIHFLLSNQMIILGNEVVRNKRDKGSVLCRCRRLEGCTYIEVRRAKAKYILYLATFSTHKRDKRARPDPSICCIIRLYLCSYCKT